MSIQARFHHQLGDFLLDVDLNLPDVGISVIYGPSGCGKTTLLRLIAGLDRCDTGSFSIGQSCWQDKSLFMPTHERALGYVFQEASLFPHLSVSDNIYYGLKRSAKRSQVVSLDNIIQLLGISELLGRQIQTLSGGERQRVAIARALAAQPELLLMDEPLAAIDTQRKLEILPYLQKLHSQLQIPVIYVTHSLSEAAQLADQLVVMGKGRITAVGNISEMLTRLDLGLSEISGGLSSGLSGQSEQISMIPAQVTSIDQTYGTSLLAFAGGQFTLASTAMNIGDDVRLQIRADDVSLNLEQAKSSSILNIFPAEVLEIVAETSSQVLIKLTIGESLLLSRISLKSATLLHLKVGSLVFVQIKSAALLN
ncbi:MAG: molybdenum ABC transporter ATP-binding protein [Xanthomonadales bacterium]|nr:molybdenum ABC transporter ATP-binding protein [Xanthomonadales bacterium]